MNLLLTFDEFIEATNKTSPTNGYQVTVDGADMLAKLGATNEQTSISI